MGTQNRLSRGNLASMEDLDRKLRAAKRRQTASLNRASLGGIEQDPSPLFGLAAVSLVQQLVGGHADAQVQLKVANSLWVQSGDQAVLPSFVQGTHSPHEPAGLS